MDLFNVIVIVVFIGTALYLINRFVPMQDPIKTILNVFVVVVLCLWLLRMVLHSGHLYTGCLG